MKYSTQAFNQFWINEMAKKVKKIIVLTMYKGEYQLEDNVVVYSIGKEKGYSKFRRFLKFYSLLFKIFKENKIDVVFSHMMPVFVVMAGLVLKIKKIPIFLWYCHGNVTQKLRLAVLFSKKVFTCSNLGMNVYTKKKKVIGHGINTELFKYHPHKQKENLLLHVGRISPIKNVHILIEVMNILVHQKKIKDLKLVLIGEPMELKKDMNYFFKLNMGVTKNKLDKHVFFLGMKSQADLLYHYRDSKFLLNLSDTKSLDKVLLEAMACGCIPVSSNSSFKMLYKKHFPQLIVTKDAIEIAEKMMNLILLNKQELEILRKALRINVNKNHTLDRLVTNIYCHMEKFV